MGKVVDYLEKYYKETNYNCAEAVFSAAAEAWNMDISDDVIRTMGCFGGGMGCQKTCGALAGAVAALGILTIKTKQKESQNSRKLIGEFLLEFEGKFNSVNCIELKPKFAVPSIGCKQFVGDVAELLEEFIKKNNL